MERLTAEGRTFEVLVASDVVRDGLGVELHELLPGDERRLVMEIFRFDDPDTFETKPVRTAITHCSNEVPLHLAKEVAAIAEREFVVNLSARERDSSSRIEAALERMVKFHDVVSGDEGFVLVRSAKKGLALTVSLRHDGDVEAHLPAVAAEELRVALRELGRE